MDIGFLQGNEALVEGALRAGCRFFAGYPITPSTEIAEHMAKRLPELGGRFIQMEDEISSIAAVIGASWTGMKAMTATSGPGFSLMQENIGYAVMTETPIVVVDVQRGGPSTGQATKTAQGDVMQARYGSHGDYSLIVLAPFSVQECYELVVRAFNLAERYRVPVILLSDEALGHSRELVRLKKLEVVTRKPIEKGVPFFGKNAEMPIFGEGHYVHVTGSTHRPDGMRDVVTPAVHSALVTHFVEKIERNRARFVQFDERDTEDAELLLLAFGSTARPTSEAVKRARAEGLNVGFFRPITLWPSPEHRLRQLSKDVEQLVLVQHSLIGYKPELERIIGREIKLYAKLGGVVHTSDEILGFVKRELRKNRKF